MITLITGLPGEGKTALAVAMMLEEQGKRPLFVSGIPELKIDHIPTPPLDEWTVEVPLEEDPTKTSHEFTFPPNSIVVIDESQRIYRPRAASSKVPPYVAAFETHRHTGVDFWLITQHPGLLDSNIKKLVKRHVHIRETPLGRYRYQWNECGDPDLKASRQLASSSRYKLPKKVFSLYKSADLHIARKSVKPLAFYLVIFCALLFLYFSYWAYSRYQDFVSVGSNPVQTPSSPVPSDFNFKSPSQRADAHPVTPQQYAESLEPRLAQLAHTAPAYDEITRPTRVPVPAGCVSTATRCQCYTQDATPYAVDETLCRQVVKGGLFLAFDPEGQRKQQVQGSLYASASPSPSTASASHPSSLVTTPYEISSQ